jgi:predicted protein tyrosine phosphatase
MNVACYDDAPEWRIDETTGFLEERDAQRIAAFVGRYWRECVIVINCIAGISRSAGAAVGIRNGLGLDAGAFGKVPYDPNPHVQRLVKKAVAERRHPVATS